MTDNNKVPSPDDFIAYAKYAKVNGEEDAKKKIEVMQEGNRLYPDNLDVKYYYAKMLYLLAHVYREGGVPGTITYPYYSKCMENIESLDNCGYSTKEFNLLKKDAYLDAGLVANEMQKYEEVVKWLSKADREKDPFAALLIVIDTIFDGDSDIEYKYADASVVRDNLLFVKSHLDSPNWYGALPMAYKILAIAYAKGISDVVDADVEYSYYCIKKCAELDPETAGDMLQSYRKGMLGKVTFIG